VTRTERWQKKRCSLNHDWLKNQFMPGLAKLINVLDGRVIDPTFLPSFVFRLRREWGGYADELNELLQSFEEEMSPRRLFDCPPLANRGEAVAEWLPGVIHALWLSRDPVFVWTDEARTRLDDANRSHSEIIKELEHIGPVIATEALRGIRPLFGEFRAHCRDLGTAVSSFPSEIRIT